MSDLNTEILISANAEGVEAGVGRAKKSLSSLGDTAQKIGKNGADGMQALGAGADMSARKVESATKNMVGSLQRQIAAMEAGDKTSRKYQETLARMRGVDVAALKPYLDQLDSLQVKTSLAEKAQASFNSVMLKGAAVFAAAGAIASYVKIINDGVDALNDLKDATGASIENISALEDVGKRAGASFDVVSTSLIKFNNVLSDAKPGSAAEQAIKALGLSIEDLKRLDPAEALRQTSVALNRFADDGDKARLVQELFGKSVKEVAPFLKDLAESSALVAKVTTEQAEQAEKFNKELSALGKNAQDASRALVSPMVSALNDVIAKFKEGREAGKSFLEIANSRYWSNIRDFYGMTQPAAPSTGGATGSWGDGPDSKPSVGPLPDTKKPKGPTKAELSEYDKLIQKLGVDLPKAAAEAEAAQMGYNKAQTEFLALAGSEVWAKFTNSQRATVAALFENKIASEQAADAAKTLAKANLDAAASREKYLTSLSAGLDKIQADIAAQIEATERMGLSKEAIAELDAAKLEMLATDLELQAIKAMDRNLDQQTYDALKQQAQAYRELGIAKKGGAAKDAALDLEKANADAVKKAQEEWERASEKINDTLTDALMRGFESGKDFAKNLRDTVVNMFKTMVLRPVVSAIVNPISQGITGMMGLSGAANAGQSALSTIGTGASIFNAGSALGGLGAVGGAMSGFATAATASVQSLLGMSGTVAQMTTSLAAAGHTAAAGVSAGVQAFQAIPGWGWAIGAVAALAAIFGKKSTPHMGSASSYSEAGGLVSNADIYQSVGFRDARTYNAEAAAVTGGVAKAIGDTLNSTARAFGKTAGYEITTAFADDKSKDGAWGSLIIKQMGEAVIDWRDTQTSRWAPKEFADGEAGSKEYLAAVAKSARDALVTAIGDVDWATDMLQALGESPTLEGLAQTVQQINAAQAAFDALGKNIVGFGALTDGAISQLIKAAGGIEGLVSAASAYYDNFYSEAEKTAAVTRSVSDALAQVGLAMPATRDEFRALVESQLAMGEAGAEAVAALLGVSGAFASVVPAAEVAGQAIGDVLSEAMKRLQSDTAGLQIELLRAQGNTAGANAAQRAIDTTGFTEAEVALYDYNAALRAQISALEAATEAAAQQAEIRTGFERQVLELTGDTAALRLLDIAGMDAANIALYDRVQALQAEAEQTAIRADLERQVLELTGDSAAIRQLEIAGMDAVNVALYDRIQALQSEAQASEQAAQAAAEQAAIGESLQRQIIQLTGDSAAIRQLEIAGMDAANVALYDRVQALQASQAAEQAAAEKAKQVAQERYGIETSMLQLQGNTAALRARELALIDPANREAQLRLYLLQDSQDAAKAAADAERDLAAARVQSAQDAYRAAQDATGGAFDALSRSVEAERSLYESTRAAAADAAQEIKSVIDTLSGSIQDLYAGVDSTRQASAVEGSAFIARALQAARTTGYLPDSKGLSDAITQARGGLGSQNFATQFEADRAQLVMAGQLSELSDIAKPQLTAAERTLRNAEDQLKALDDILKNAQSQVDAVRGISTTVGTIPAALAGLQAALLSEAQAKALAQSTTAPPATAPTTPTTTTGGALSGPYAAQITDAIKAAAYTTDDRLVYDTARMHGVTSSELDELMGWTAGTSLDWAKRNNLPAFAVGTNYVPRDMVATIHEGEAIVPKAFNPWAAGGQGMGGGNTEVVAELRALRQQNERLEARLASIEGSNNTMVTLLDDVTDGGNAMRSEVMA